mmetsp:Transcript_53222/g.124674  ORF Transcript_53222/g.124674 Transcript_53222/m.124674 type:complete len:251 (-) Transcript_53222:94-846(-)
MQMPMLATSSSGRPASMRMHSKPSSHKMAGKRRDPEGLQIPCAGSGEAWDRHVCGTSPPMAKMSSRGRQTLPTGQSYSRMTPSPVSTPPDLQTSPTSKGPSFVMGMPLPTAGHDGATRNMAHVPSSPHEPVLPPSIVHMDPQEHWLQVPSSTLLPGLHDKVVAHSAVDAEHSCSIGNRESIGKQKPVLGKSLASSPRSTRTQASPGSHSSGGWSRINMLVVHGEPVGRTACTSEVDTASARATLTAIAMA